jgi:hypothetical protein
MTADLDEILTRVRVRRVVTHDDRLVDRCRADRVSNFNEQRRARLRRPATETSPRDGMGALAAHADHAYRRAAARG